MAGAPVHCELLAAQAAGAAIVPVPLQGPSKAVNVGQESAVPVNDEQFYGLTHPEFPPQTQVDNQVLHSASLLAVVFKTQVLLMQASVAAAVEAFVQGTLFPVNALQIV